MKTIKIISDQLYNWSDYHEREIYNISSSKAKNTHTKTTLNRDQHHPWVFIGTIQAMWETTVQMCTWPWTWSKILFVSKPPWQKTGSGICTQRLCRTGRAVSFKFQKGKTHPGRNKQHQPGNSPAQRTIVEQRNGYHYQSFYRYKGNWLPGSKYDLRFPKEQSIRGGGK